MPEDNLLSRVNPERSKKLLSACVRANFNTIRVWGGGYYPDDWFFDLCDELGLIVWQSFMFSWIASASFSWLITRAVSFIFAIFCASWFLITKSVRRGCTPAPERASTADP